HPGPRTPHPAPRTPRQRPRQRQRQRRAGWRRAAVCRHPYALVHDGHGPEVVQVWELVKAGGWPMLPLILLGLVALAIVIERLWTLRRVEVMPPRLGEEVRNWAARGELEPAHIESLRRNSPLGALLAAADRKSVVEGK